MYYSKTTTRFPIAEAAKFFRQNMDSLAYQPSKPIVGQKSETQKPPQQVAQALLHQAQDNR